MKENNNKKMIHVNPKMKPPWQKRRKWHEKRIKGEKEKRKEKALQGWKNRKTQRKGRRQMTRQIHPSPHFPWQPVVEKE